MTKLTLHFQDMVSVERLAIIAQSMGLTATMTDHPGTFCHKVTIECPDRTTHDALKAAWIRATTERK